MCDLEPTHLVTQKHHIQVTSGTLQCGNVYPHHHLEPWNLFVTTTYPHMCFHVMLGSIWMPPILLVTHFPFFWMTLIEPIGMRSTWVLRPSTMWPGTMTGFLVAQCLVLMQPMCNIFYNLFRYVLKLFCEFHWLFRPPNSGFVLGWVGTGAIGLSHRYSLESMAWIHIMDPHPILLTLHKRGGSWSTSVICPRVQNFHTTICHSYTFIIYLIGGI